MKFQIKIILATTLVLISVLFYLNTMVINYMEDVREDLLSKAYEKDKPTQRDFVDKRIHEYIFNVLLWEFLLVLALMLILYKVINRMTRQEREYREFLELLLLTISHKFGNLLAAQKGNIDILKVKYDQKAIERLEKTYDFIREDLNSILVYIERFKDLSSEREEINLRELIKKCLNLQDEKKEIFFRERDVYLYANRQILENIIIPLLENAAKYSDGRIFIRLTKKYLAIRNKISITDRGAGIGLKIAEKLAEKQGFKLLYRGKEDYFISILKFK